MLTIKQRIGELRQAGFKPVRDIFVLAANYGNYGNYGLNTEDYQTLTYDDGLELVTDFTPAVRRGSQKLNKRGSQKLNKRTRVDYVYCRDGEMPAMLRFMQPRITGEEMGELLRPLKSGEKVRKVQVGKRVIIKMHPLGDSALITYHMSLQLHRIWEPSPWLNVLWLGASCDFLLPHPDYYSAKQ